MGCSAAPPTILCCASSEAELAHINRVTMMGELTGLAGPRAQPADRRGGHNARTCVRWLPRDEPDLEEAREAAGRIVNDGTRAAEIIRRIRAFYTKDPPERKRST
jgi:hypothetical protein